MGEGGSRGSEQAGVQWDGRRREQGESRLECRGMGEGGSRGRAGWSAGGWEKEGAGGEQAGVQGDGRRGSEQAGVQGDGRRGSEQAGVQGELPVVSPILLSGGEHSTI